MLSLCESQAVLPARRLLHAALRIRKNMKSKSQRPAEEDVWGGPAVLLAPGQARPAPARIFPQSGRTNTNPSHRARPPADPWGTPAVSCAGATPDRSDWSRPRTGAGEKCPSTTVISSTLIPIGCLFAVREDSAGRARGKPAVWRSACQRGVQAARESKSQTTLHSATRRIAAQLVDSPCKIGTAASSG